MRRSFHEEDEEQSGEFPTMGNNASIHEDDDEGKGLTEHAIDAV
jgi:hypothetical protein